MQQRARIANLTSGLLAALGLLTCGLALAQEIPAAIPAPVPDSPPAAAAPETPPQPQPEIPVLAGKKYRSLLFAPEEIADMRNAVSLYKQYAAGRMNDENFDEEDFLNKLTRIDNNAPVASQFFVYPQFFLESLVYHGPANWAVWINGQKITQETPKENADLSVVSINEDAVNVAWKPVAMEKVNEVWIAAPTKDAQVDERQGIVYFTLKPNQTFSSYSMKILEGKVQPMTLDNNASAVNKVAAIGEQQEDKAAAAEEPAAAPAARHEGLGGLIDSYSHIGSPNAVPPATPTPAPPPAQETAP